MTSKIIFVSSS